MLNRNIFRPFSSVIFTFLRLLPSRRSKASGTFMGAAELIMGKKAHSYRLKNRLFIRIYWITMLLIFVAVTILVVAITAILSKQALKTKLSYNDSATMGISNFLDGQRKELIDLINTTYMSSYSDQKMVFGYLEYDEDSIEGNFLNASQDKMYMVNFIRRIFTSKYSSSALLIYAPFFEEVVSIYGTKYPTYSAANDIFQPLIQCYQSHSTYRSVSVVPSRVSSLQSESSAPSDSRTYGMIYPINSLYTYNRIGTVQIDYPVTQISNFLYQYYPGVGSDFLLLNSDNQVLYSSMDRYYDTANLSYETLIEASRQGALITLDGTKYYINCQEVPGLPVVVVGLLSQHTAYAGVRSILALTALCAFVMLLFLSIFTSIAMRRNSRNLSRIRNSMELVQQGNLQAYIQLNSSSHDELYDITVAYNEMLHNLNDYISKVYVAELEKQEYILMALQAQINPHFLYNTLEAIRMKAVIEEKPEIAEMVLILSKIFRNACKGDGTSTIEVELENCINYLRLHEVRHKNQLNYLVDVDEEIYQYKIVQYALQVAIENYMFHGFDSTRTDNCIHIYGRKEGDMIFFSIENNGIGLSEEELQALNAQLESPLSQFDIKKRKGIGLVNVSKRLSVVFGEDSKMSVDAMEPSGIKVNIRFRATM